MVLPITLACSVCAPLALAEHRDAPRCDAPHVAHVAPTPGTAHEQPTPPTAVPPQAAPALQWDWFPAAEPHLAPYLASLNMYGSNCLAQDSLIPSDPLSEAAQWVKTELARYGINYRLNQSYSFAAMSNVTRGNHTLNFYNMQLLANWVVFNSTDLGGTSGWLTLQANAGLGLGFELRDESPQQNIGTATWPNYGWVTSEAYISQVSWSQSFFDGQLIVQGGMVDPTIAIDANQYANDQYSQLMNWAFVNSQVLPYAFGSLGAMVQWQPLDWLYFMVSTGANNTPSGRPPWYEVSGRNWSTIGEIGLISENTFGLGPGVFRVQPFIATVAGDTSAGVAFNIEQQLGHESPFAVYARVGFGTDETARINGAQTQAAGGLAIIGPDPSGKLRQAFDYFAIGAAWTRSGSPAATHEDEFLLEATIVRNITPTLAIQPDLQLIWDPSYGTSDFNVLFQVQLVFTW